MTTLNLGILLWSQGATWPETLDAAKRVERLGYEHLWTWDHLYAIFGDPYQPIFEGWALLRAWARETERTRLGLLVGANTFRNPGVVAKLAATLDHVSDGRAILGIGGAWIEPEHKAHGIEFGSGFGQRLDWLDESVGGDACAPRRPVGHVAARRALLVRPSATQSAPAPAATADHDRRLWREEDAPDGRALRGHVERDGSGRGDAPQDRGAPRPLRGCRARHRPRSSSPSGSRRRSATSKPRPTGSGRPRWSTTGRRSPTSPTTTRSGTARRSSSPSGSGRTSSWASKQSISEQPAPYDTETFERLIGQVKPLVEAGSS